MSSRGSTARTARYSPPLNSAIIHTTVAGVLAERRSLNRVGQIGLPDSFELADREIWCAGDPALLQKTCVAIVGTRNVSEAGAMRARRLAKELAARGHVVVSGLAKGVDTEALRAAIASHGSVAAVIGTPLQKAYPIENAGLQEEIAKAHLLVSPYAAGTRTFPSHFPERNRIMAAVSDATVIIEAGNTSGTLHQAAECVRLGRWLFIARNVIEDTSLTWPSGFQSYERTRTLSELSDLLSVLQPI